MKIIVFGGSGFIGGHIARRLAREGHDVTATWHNTPPYSMATNFGWRRADLRGGYDFLQPADLVIHAAAVTSGINDTVNRPEIHVTDNVLMNTCLVRDAVAAKVPRFIFLSSSLVYESNPQPQTETQLSYAFAGERQKYFGVGWMKIYAEKLMEFYASHSATRFTVLRPANIYGPGDKFDLERSHVMGATIRKFVEAERTGADEVVMWGDGSEGRDFLYIDDLVEGVVRAVNRAHATPPFEVYNLGTGQATSIRELASRVATASGIAGQRLDLTKITFDPSKPSGKTWLALDSTKARQHLDWVPEVALDEGITDTYAWCNYTSL